MDTKHKEIVDYWSSHQDECGLSVDWDEAEKRCWRCAQERLLQRCHIVPRALGGSEHPSNLVLMCGQCHAEAPNVSDPDFIWVWLRAHAVPFYGTYWQERGFREYQFIYGREPFIGLKNPEKLMAATLNMLDAIFARTSTHWGQGKLNPATWAWVLHQVDQQARKKFESAAETNPPA